MDNDNTRRRRKLLVASIGVATVSYAVLTACGKDNVPTSGNLPAPPPMQSTPPVTGNLPAPPPPEDAAPPPAASDAGPATVHHEGGVPPHDAGARLRPPISGNLPAPPPVRDAGKPNAK